MGPDERLKAIAMCIQTRGVAECFAPPKIFLRRNMHHASPFACS